MKNIFTSVVVINTQATVAATAVEAEEVEELRTKEMEIAVSLAYIRFFFEKNCCWIAPKDIIYPFGKPIKLNKIQEIKVELRHQSYHVRPCKSPSC